MKKKKIHTGFIQVNFNFYWSGKTDEGVGCCMLLCT